MGCCGDSNTVEDTPSSPTASQKEHRRRSSSSRSPSREEKYGPKHKYEADFRGPITKDRGCTDCFCALLFLVFLAGWIAIAIYGFIHGNPERIVRPSDSSGDICGRGNYQDKPYILFFDLTKCIRVDSVLGGCPTKQVCVETCPNEFQFPWKLGVESAGEEKTKKEEFQKYCGPLMTQAVIDDDSYTLRDLISKHICPPWVLPSKALLKRCIPIFGAGSGSTAVGANKTLEDGTIVVEADETPEGESLNVNTLKKAITAVGELINLQGVGQRFMADLVDTWWMVFIGLCLALVLSLLWICLMRYVAAVMVWLSLLVSILLLIGGAAYSMYKYLELKDKPAQTATQAKEYYFNEGTFYSTVNQYTELATTWLVFFIIDVVILLIVLILIIVLRKRIKIAIELIEESSIAVGDMMSTLFFPVVPFVCEIIVIGWFILTALFLASVGEQTFYVNTEGCTAAASIMEAHDGSYKCEGNKVPDDIKEACPSEATCEFYKYGATPLAQWFLVYNFFGLLWGMFFISAFEEMVMAGAFASWYFTRDKQNDLPRMPVTSSLGRTLRYHLGTLAFGSLIIAIIRFVRVLLEYVEQKIKEARQDSPLIKAMLCCCRCCLYCLEKFMKFINRNAYIMCAIYGKSFCWCAKDSFSLLMRNMARVFVLNQVTDMLLFLGKLVVVGSVGVFSFYFFSGRLGLDLELNYYFVPVLLVIGGSFFIADIFFSVYEMGIDTIFLCFLEDIERHDGSPEKPYFMSKDLKRILGYLNEEAEDVSRPASPRSPWRN